MKFLFVILSLSFVTQTFANWKVFERYDLSKVTTILRAEILSI